MNSRFYEEQRKRALDTVKKILDDLYPHKLHWPTCYIHKTEMCEVSKKGENTFYECFEFDDECRPCGHKEYSI